MKVYVPGKTLILSNFTGKNSDRIFRPGICIDIAHNIATKKDNTEYQSITTIQELISYKSVLT